MNEIINTAEARVAAILADTKVINGVPMMSHKQIVQLTGKRQDWVKSVMDDLQNDGLIRFTEILETSHEGAGARPVKIYYVNERDSHVVVAKLSSEYTAYLVDFWFAHRNQQVQPTVQLPDFTNPAIAARAWADEVEAKLKLKEQIAQDAPKVAFAEAITASKGSLNLTATAKILNEGPKKFTERLRREGILYIKKGSNIPKQHLIDRGLFEVVSVTDRRGVLRHQTMVTGKGQDWLWAKAGYPVMHHPV